MAVQHHYKGIQATDWLNVTLAATLLTLFVFLKKSPFFLDASSLFTSSDGGSAALSLFVLHLLLDPVQHLLHLPQLQVGVSQRARGQPHTTEWALNFFLFYALSVCIYTCIYFTIHYRMLLNYRIMLTGDPICPSLNFRMLLSISVFSAKLAAQQVWMWILKEETIAYGWIPALPHGVRMFCLCVCVCVLTLWQLGEAAADPCKPECKHWKWVDGWKCDD